MTDSADPTRGPRVGGHSRRRIGVALAVAAALCVLIAVGAVPAIYALPLIGLLTVWGAHPDEVPEARPLSLSPRNLVMGSLALVALAIVGLQHRLLRLLIVMFGTNLHSLVVTLLAAGVLVVTLGMDESTIRTDNLPAHRVVLTKRNLLLALTGLFTIATWRATVGQSYLVLAVFVLVLPVALTASRLRHARSGRVERGFWRHPLAGLRIHRLQLLNILLFCALLGIASLAGTFDILRLYLSVEGHRAFQVAFVAGLVALVILAFVPLSRVYLATNLAVTAGSALLALQLIMIYMPPVEPVTVGSPLGEEWYVAHGGRAELINYHYVTSAQRHALDIVQIVDSHSHPMGSSDLDSYYIFGAPVLAPAEGIVTSIVDGLADQPIGSVDNQNSAGNHLVIDISGGRYLMLGHLRQGSIRVAIGDRLIAGQVIAEVGNSGNTTEPHLHIQAFNLHSFDLASSDLPELLRIARTYPLVFRDVILTRNGSVSKLTAADPRRGDSISAMP